MGQTLTPIKFFDQDITILPHTATHPQHLSKPITLAEFAEGHWVLSLDIVEETGEYIATRHMPASHKSTGEFIQGPLAKDAPEASHWDEQPGFPVEDWQAEVANDDTRLGYLDWVNAGQLLDYRGPKPEPCFMCGFENDDEALRCRACNVSLVEVK